MIVLGCKYLRICHLNNCATGMATQDERLRRDHFKGLPERVECYFRNVAEDVREWLALLGLRTLDEAIGRTDLLEQHLRATREDVDVDLSRLLARDPAQASAYCGSPALQAPADGLAAQLDAALADAIASGAGGAFVGSIRNTDRSIGARLSGRIARVHGDTGMSATPIDVRLSGSAGQSFGAFNAGGLHLHLQGEANDYVGKGMAGGRIVLQPPGGSRFASQDTPILGNTCLYGATGGELFAAGRAGERFAVRNSGATAVIEGAGDHCCEYMTGGAVVVLGRTGLNFGAGFTGGLAYVLDLERDFVDRYNHELVDISRITPEGLDGYRQHLTDLIEAHARLTGSAWSARIRDDFRDFVGKFWLVKPKAASLEALAHELKRAA
jgi:glutamate synthase (NADPH/NADH) large chain